MLATPRLRWLLLGLATLCSIERAPALDPAWATSQYIRDQWDANNGFVGGSVKAIAQTKDGYLWIGTDRGLYRFDGVKFVAAQQPGQAPPLNVLGLTTDDSGDLWIRAEESNVLRYKDGVFRDMLPDDGRHEQGVTAMSRGLDGAVLFSTITHGVFRYRQGRLEPLMSSTAIPSYFLITSIAQTADGRIWFGTRDHGLFYLERGTVTAITDRLPDKKINCLLSMGDGALLVGTDNGLVRLDKGRISQVFIQPPLRNTVIATMAKDRDGNVWVGTDHSVVRLNSNGAVRVDLEGGHSSDSIGVIFEGREGNIWLGCKLGLVRLRNGVFLTYSARQGIPSASIGPVYVDATQRVWFAPVDGGLYRIEDGKIESITTAGLSHDVVYSITGDRNHLWIGRQGSGLTELPILGNSIAVRTYKRRDGLAQDAVYTVYQSRDGTVWAGTLSGGLSRLKDGKFLTYTRNDGLGSNNIYSIEEDRNGAMWVGTSRGLSTFANGHWRNFALQDGLPSNDVFCLHQDSEGTLWIGTPSGLAYMRFGQIHTVNATMAPLREPIFGMTEDGSDSLWIATASHILRVDRKDLLNETMPEGGIREYGIEDGLLKVGGVRRDRSVASDGASHIWFSTPGGLSTVDWRRQSEGSPPAIANIDAISSDGNPVAFSQPIRIPPSPRRVAIDYTGLILSAPSRVRFQYKLEGFDRDWSDPVSAKQAVYTNLPPGNYRFIVKASNSDGVWNGSEAALAFRIDPAFWQTGWFQLLCAFSVLYIARLLYLSHMNQITKQLNARFDERLAERTRIAHELHDTLLQGFLSASMQLHMAAEKVPENSAAKPQLNHILDLMGQVSEEGRNALRGLRSSVRDAQSLEKRFSSITKELSLSEDTNYRVVVDGPVRPLHPVILDEIYCIGREALANAVRHAKASSIEVELEYAAAHLLVAIRDNGCGIDPNVLKSGKDGHWGLACMRERAEGIGAELRLFSHLRAGTEVKLTVPGKIAYERQPNTSWRGRLRNVFHSRSRL